MTKTNKVNTLLYLGRFQFDYYAEEAAQSVRYTFPPEIVRDLDVVNPEALKEQIKVFITQQKLPAAELTILLADDILFSKNIVVLDLKEREHQIQEFLESVPFEETAMTKISLETNTVISVANKSYFESFKQAFEAQGSSVLRVFPAFLLAKEVNLAKNADVSSLALALKKAPSLQQYNLLAPLVSSNEILSRPVLGTSASEKPDKKRLFIMVGALGLLLVVLVIVILISMRPPEPIPATSTVTPPPLPLAPVTPTGEPASQSASLSSVETAQITYSATQNTIATQLQSELQTLGVPEVTIAPEQTERTGSLVIFSSGVTLEDREAITSTITALVPDVSVQEASNAAVDIMINL